MILNVYRFGFTVCLLRKVLKDSENIQIHIDDDGRDEKQKDGRKPKNRIEDR